MKKLRYSVFFCDYDGTLASDDHTVSRANRDAIAAYVAAGGAFVLSTGRLFRSARPLAKELGLHGMLIACQGAGVYDIDDGRCLWANALESDVAIAIAEYLESRPECVPMMYLDDECVTVERNPYTDRFVEICKIPYRTTGGAALSQYLRDDRTRRPTKLLALVQPQDAVELCERGAQALGERAEFCRSQDFIVEIMPPYANKGVACKYVCERLGLDASDAVAIGDSENDLSMIRFAGLGVAVANAFDNVRAQADRVATNNNDDAIAQVIRDCCIEE